ncbi:MAG: peptide chain release factor N(5)-glutamine methyltransferase [Planctomycetes bacterium]|nr:peptide chain release factor N(5)-glutamine methyltransferase [Planctomycetota bacterium]
MRGERTLREALAWGTLKLSLRGVEEPRLDSELLLAHVLGGDRAALFVRASETLARARRRAFALLLRRRRARVPLAYLVGRREFYGLDFAVGEGVLVPRPETEGVVSWALEFLRARPGQPLVLDAGTGSGNIAVALARNDARARVVAVDRSARALACARQNAQRHGVARRVHLCCCDVSALAHALQRARFDMLVSNPPYVERPQDGFRDELCHEPLLALCGRGKPFPAIYESLAVAAAALLLPGGRLIVEVGAGQARRVREILAAHAGSTLVEERRDLAGIPRVVSCVFSGARRPRPAETA